MGNWHNLEKGCISYELFLIILVQDKGTRLFDEHFIFNAATHNMLLQPEQRRGRRGGVCKTGNKKGKELIVCEFKLGTAVMEKIEQPSDPRAILLLTSDWQTFFKIGHPLPFFL